MPAFTRKAIIDSFLKLLREKTVDKITVKDIVEECGINRNTFYYHFDDIPTMIEEILEEETEKVLGKNLGSDSWEEGFIAAIEFALDNKKSIYHLYTSAKREVFERYLNRIGRDVIHRYVTQQAEGLEVSEADKELLTVFYCAALTGLVVSWLDGNMKGDARTVIRHLGKMLDGEIREALVRASKNPLPDSPLSADPFE